MKTENINKPTHICWSNISQELNYLITPKYVYIVVLQNQFDIFTKLKCHNDNFKQHPDGIDVDNSCSITSSNSDTGINEPDSFKFNIILSVKEWKKIYTSNKIYNRFDQKNVSWHYKILAPNKWTKLFIVIFFNKWKNLVW